MKTALLAIAMLFVLVSCAGGGNTYCNDPDDNYCVEYDIANHSKDDANNACNAAGGTVVDACPTENQVGSCAYGEGFTIYYFSPFTSQDAEQACDLLSGTFAAP